MNCRCDFESHGHKNVCNKKVSFRDSQMWQSCSHDKNITDSNGLIEEKVRGVCYCVQNRCCLDCWEREVAIAKGSILRSLKIMNQNYKPEI